MRRRPRPPLSHLFLINLTKNLITADALNNVASMQPPRPVRRRPRRSRRHSQAPRRRQPVYTREKGRHAAGQEKGRRAAGQREGRRAYTEGAALVAPSVYARCFFWDREGAARVMCRRHRHRRALSPPVRHRHAVIARSIVRI